MLYVEIFLVKAPDNCSPSYPLLNEAQNSAQSR